MADEKGTGQLWRDGYYWSRDSLRLHYRDYPGRADRPAILCLPGLTRNARDFEALAARLAGEWRVIVVSLRGRGESAYAKDPLTYVPLTYLQDLDALLHTAGIERFAVIGTSLGGLLALMLAPTHRAMLAGVVLNDIGPSVEPAGVARIRSYVGRSGNWPTWLHAARDIAAINRGQFPDADMGDWLRVAKQRCRLTPNGRVVWDYDARIAEPFRLPHGDGAIDLWPALGSLRDKPTLSVRGALSDILTAEIQARMQAQAPWMTTLTIPNIGHAPSLSEAEARPALDRWLQALISA